MFDVRAVIVAPGDERKYDEDEWRDACRAAAVS